MFAVATPKTITDHALIVIKKVLLGCYKYLVVVYLNRRLSLLCNGDLKPLLSQCNPLSIIERVLIVIVCWSHFDHSLRAMKAIYNRYLFFLELEPRHRFWNNVRIKKVTKKYKQKYGYGTYKPTPVIEMLPYKGLLM